jgi:hypothetical protein
MATATKDKKTADVPSQVVKLKKAGSDFAEIAEQLDISVGKAKLFYLVGQTDPADRFEAKNDADLAKRVVALRDKDKLSWGIISARSGVPESRLRKIYEDTTGTPTLGNRIGKGGRFPSGETPPKPVKAKTAKAAKETKEASAGKPVSAEQAKVPIGDMNLAQLKDRLNGKTITVDREGGKQERIGVKSVSKLKDGEMQFADKDGKSRTVLVAQIRKATR